MWEVLGNFKTCAKNAADFEENEFVDDVSIHSRSSYDELIPGTGHWHSKHHKLHTKWLAAVLSGY